MMAGAILVGLLAFHFAGCRVRSFLGVVLSLPDARRIDCRLVLGSLVVGADWGLAGYCPGPALASLLSGGNKPVIVAAAVVAGMVIVEMQERRAQVAQRTSA